MERPFNRRRFIVLATGAATATALLATTEVAQAHTGTTAPEAGPVAPVYLDAIKPLDRLKKTNDELGYQRLTVPQAKLYIVQLAEWSQSANDRSKNELVLPEKTFLLTRGPETKVKPPVDEKADPMTDPLILHFYQNYPDYKYDIVEARKLLHVYHMGATGATPTEGPDETFINLDYTNNINEFLQGPGTQYTSQYHGTEAHPIKTEPTPAIILGSTTKHEWKHLINHGIKIPLDPDIISYLRNFRGVNTTKNKYTGFHDKFAVFYEMTTAGGAVIPSYEVVLNEFSTDFSATIDLQDAGLPFAPGYGRTPLDYYNFRKILEQSDIPIKSFDYLYDNALLKDFYHAVGLGAYRDRTGTDRMFSSSDSIHEIIPFMTKILPWWAAPVWQPSERQTARTDISKHYRGLALAA